MADWFIILILAISAIIGYRLMGLVDRSISQYAVSSEKPEQEKNTDEHTETGESERSHFGMPFFLDV